MSGTTFSFFIWGFSAALGILIALPATPAFGQAIWPDLSAPVSTLGGGEKDSAVVVAVENYAKVAPVPGALQNADDWYSFLTESLRVPAERVSLLRDEDATAESMRERARRAATEVKPGGTLWFVFIGHGAPAKDGKDGLLVGWDAQQKAESLFARSLGQKELLRSLAVGRQGKTVVLVDACFSGRTPEGEPLAKGLQPLILMMDGGTAQISKSRAILMTAARADQFAGPLPGASRPAFSYLALGGLRGWAAGPKGKITAEGLIGYVRKTLRTLQSEQEPELRAFARGQVLTAGWEKGPNLRTLLLGRESRRALQEPDRPAAAKTAAQRAAQKTPGKTGRENIRWVKIPGGTFSMGAEFMPWTRPVHQVRIKPFEMAKTLVTFKQYRTCVEAGACSELHVSNGTCLVRQGTGSSWGHGILPRNFQGDDQPAVCVDWHQAQAFSAWVGGRLPTEAEWEYAARSAGKDQEYPWGDEKADCSRAVMADHGAGCGRFSTWPVCSKPQGSTKQGLCDMAGNVWEWTKDWFNTSYEGAPADGSAWENPTGTAARVGRGGSWRHDSEWGVRAANRGFGGENHPADYFGFRPARDIRNIR